MGWFLLAQLFFILIQANDYNHFSNNKYCIVSLKNDIKNNAMQKILLGIDAINPDVQSFVFACYLTKICNATLVGVFLENIVQNEMILIRKIKKIVNRNNEVMVQEILGRRNNIENNIKIFKEQCQKNKINFLVHRDRGVPIEEMIEESRFADVLIIDAETSFHKKYEVLPTEFVYTLVKKSECPIIIAPAIFESIQEIIYCYENSNTTLFAIKQFTHLFPMLNNIKIVILQINESGLWHNIEKHQLNEWLKIHYNNIHYEAIEGTTETVLPNYLINKKKCMVIMGSYSRNKLSELFKHSNTEQLIKSITQPMFIAHH